MKRWLIVPIVLLVLALAAVVVLSNHTRGETGGGPGPGVVPVRLVSVSLPLVGKTIPCPCGGSIKGWTMSGNTGAGDSGSKTKGGCVGGYATAHTYVEGDNLLGMKTMWINVKAHWCSTMGPDMALRDVQWTLTHDSWANISMTVENSYVHWWNRYSGSTTCGGDTGVCTDVVYYRQMDAKVCALIKPLCVDYHPWVKLHLGEGAKHSGSWG